jgi:hypothetical protein
MVQLSRKFSEPDQQSEAEPAAAMNAAHKLAMQRGFKPALLFGDDGIGPAVRLHSCLEASLTSGQTMKQRGNLET